MKITVDLNTRNTLRCLLGIIFVWAAVSKLANLQDFYASLRAYQLPLPGFILRSTAVVLPWLELFTGLMLLTRFWFRVALSWALVLCAVFMISTGQAWARGLEISCGCLNLDFIGLGGPANASAKAFLESAGFACGRAGFLLAVGIYLWRGSRTIAPQSGG